MECDICNSNKVCFKCDGCRRKICKQCGKLSSSETRCLELKERVLKLYCSQCDENNSINLFRRIIEGKDKLIESQDKTIKLLEQKIQELEQEEHLYKQNKKYSDVVKSNKEAVIVVKPKDTKQQSNKTKEIIQDSINPQAAGTSVSKLKYIRDGGVAICCEEKGAEKIIKEAEQKLGNEYNVAVVKKANPKIKLINVNKKDINEEKEFIEKLVFHNHINIKKENYTLNVINKFKSKSNTRHCHVIVEVDSLTYTELCKNEYIQTGWKGCKYEDYINIVQCYKCYKFGHKAINCKSEKNICPKCAGDHKVSECTSEETCCNNCKYAIKVLKVTNVSCDHTAYNKD